MAVEEKMILAAVFVDKINNMGVENTIGIW